MIVLFTDFGLTDPYVGQLHAVLAREAPGVPVIDLFHAVPDFNIRAAAYLLPAYVHEFPPGTVFVCVVDPGVGGARRPLMLKADGRWYVGPDNGLFEMVKRRAGECDCRVIRWRPPRLSASFHGRDLFAPVAARLACGDAPPGRQRRPDDFIDTRWPADLDQIIYIDHFGNAMTGIRASSVADSTLLRFRGHVLSRARTFSDVPVGSGFCYKNALGLVEIAVNCGRADQVFGAGIGDVVDKVEQGCSY